MTNIHTKPSFYILMAFVVIVVIIVYLLNKTPDSFEVNTSGLLGLAKTKIEYRKHNDKYYKKITTSVSGGGVKEGIETEITKSEYKSAYKQYLTIETA